MRSTIGLCLAVALAAAAGCGEAASLEKALIDALTARRTTGLEEPGNLVISYVNDTNSPVQWQLAWEGGGALEPTAFTAQLDAGQAQTITLTGPVFRVWPGRPDRARVAATVRPAGAEPVEVPYAGPALDLGVDYRLGDIITCRITEAPRGQYQIVVEVAGGI